MIFRRSLALLLAVLLQAMPLMLAALPVQSRGSDSAWVAGAPKLAASLGSYDAVSSATTIINGPYNVTGTVGKALTARRLTTSPHVAGAWSSAPSPLAPGVNLSATTGTISGTPTIAGTFTATITAWEFGVGQGSSTSSTFIFIFTNAASPPKLTNSPASQIVVVGSNPTFTAGASGSAPLSYQWQFSGTNIFSATNTILQLGNAQTNQSGVYAVVVSNAAGSASSQPAQLLVVPPPDPTVSPALIASTSAPGLISITFTTLPGYNYLLQSASALDGSSWVTLTNVAAAFNGAAINVAQKLTDAPERFYRVLVQGP